MIYQELVTEIEKLPLDKQLSLLETLAKAISRRASKTTFPQTALKQVRGLLKPTPDEPVATDVDLPDNYTDYLLKKYS